ncbi:MAG: hypothetical protein OHK0029_18300 [Armatimonadaceae bacterium]
MELTCFTRFSLGQPLGQMRAVPVRNGDTGAVLLVYAGDYDVDPWHEMFFYPTDTLKLTLVSRDGKVLWTHDLGRGVPPGMWFCPVLPFDLDGDGVEEIWVVGNEDTQHPLSQRHRVLMRLNPETGTVTGTWKWLTKSPNQTISHAYRNFLIGGYVNGKPVLVTAQGTYGDMFLQGWNAGMEPRWETAIAKDSAGARGSHMCPVVDINGDGTDELFWGERCLSLNDGAELFCADADTYRGHSDIIQPVLCPDGQWRIYTCRESEGDVSPRVVTFDAEGSRLWGDLEQGHMDMGWVARIGDNQEFIATAIRISQKQSGPGGHIHSNREEFAWDIQTGEARTLPFTSYQTLPVDLNGDGYHELVRGLYQGDGTVWDRTGRTWGSVGGSVALAGKFMDRPGEQLVVFQPDGTVSFWGDNRAEDTPEASARYAHPFYANSLRLMASGYNKIVLGGI